MAKSNEIRVLLMCSGRTEWDEAGRLSGSCDLPMSSAGRDEAEAAAQAFGGKALSVIYCGPDDASVAKAECVAKATGAKVKPVADLAEPGLGLWEGLLDKEIEDKYPTSYRQWLEDPASVIVPEGEPLTEAEGRILSALVKSLDKAKDNGAGVGVVLRPMAMGLVRGWLAGDVPSNLWSMVRDCPAAEWKLVPRTALKRTWDESRAGA